MKKLLTIFAIIGFFFISISHVYSQKTDEFPQIQKYLDKLTKLEMGDGDEPIKIKQVLKGNSLTAIRDWAGDVDKEHYENIPWHKYFYIHFFETGKLKEYSRCIFYFRSFMSLTTITKNMGDTKDSIKKDDEITELSILIHTKDQEEVEKIVKDFIKNKNN